MKIEYNYRTQPRESCFVSALKRRENMILIGELLNSTRKKIRSALAAKDDGYIREIALKQQEAGAHYLDVNAGAFSTSEPQYLEWMISVITETTSLPLCVDSPKPEALALGCRLAGSPVILNSITAEKEHFSRVLPIVKEFDAGVIALPLDETGLSGDEDKIYNIACRLVENLAREGIPPDRIFLDTLIRPLSTDISYGELALNLIRRFSSHFPEVHRVCGLSNISFGLPKRKLINQTFLVMAMASGLNAAILDPLDNLLMAQVKAAQALLAQDPFCMDYINFIRSGK